MNFLGRGRVPASTFPIIIDRYGRLHAATIAFACAFFATPFQAAASYCSLPDVYELVDCCGSEATVANAALIDQREKSHGINDGRLQLRLNVSYSPGSGYTWSPRACAKLNVIVRLGEFTKTYAYTASQPGAPAYIEDTPMFFFKRPFRPSQVFVESVSCKMPEVMLGGRSCGSDEENEREERALAEERERHALEEERQRQAQEQERLAQEQEEQERLAQQLKDEQDELDREQDQRLKENEIKRLAQQQADHQRQAALEEERQRQAQEQERLAQEQEEQERLAQQQVDHQNQPQREASEGEASDLEQFLTGLEQFLTGFQAGMAIVQGVSSLFGVGTNIPSPIGQGSASGSISEACHQAQVRVSGRLQRPSADEGMCTAYRRAAQIAEGAKRELQSAGCPASYLRQMDQFIAAARRNAQSVCVD